LNTVDAFVGFTSACAIYFTFRGSVPDRRNAGLELLFQISASVGSEYALKAGARPRYANWSAVMLTPIVQCITDVWGLPRFLARSFILRLQQAMSRLSTNAAENHLDNILTCVLVFRGEGLLEMFAGCI
jgi:hypothetical protein